MIKKNQPINEQLQPRKTIILFHFSGGEESAQLSLVQRLGARAARQRTVQRRHFVLGDGGENGFAQTHGTERVSARVQKAHVFQRKRSQALLTRQQLFHFRLAVVGAAQLAQTLFVHFGRIEWCAALGGNRLHGAVRRQFAIVDVIHS